MDPGSNLLTDKTNKTIEITDLFKIWHHDKVTYKQIQFKYKNAFKYAHENWLREKLLLKKVSEMQLQEQDLIINVEFCINVV